MRRRFGLGICAGIAVLIGLTGCGSNVSSSASQSEPQHAIASKQTTAHEPRGSTELSQVQDTLDSETTTSPAKDRITASQPRSEPANRGIAEQPATQDLDAFQQIPLLAVHEAQAHFDLARFPTPGGNSPEQSFGPTSAFYRVYEDMPKVLEEMEQTFEQLKWKELGRTNSKDSISLQLTDGKLFYSCQLAQRGAAASTGINLATSGNVDMRMFPVYEALPGATKTISSVSYRSKLGQEDLMERIASFLHRSGWQEFRRTFDVESGEIRDDLRYFRRDGIKIFASVNSISGATHAYISAEMFNSDIPTPLDATELVLDDHPTEMTFRSKLSVQELVEFFALKMKQAGWILNTGRQLDSVGAGMFFTSPNKDPIFLEIVARDDDNADVYMGRPTVQVRRAIIDGEFQYDYKAGLEVAKSQMHSLDYRAIPFHDAAEAEGSGRTIASSVFFNFKLSIEDMKGYYREYFEKQGWELVEPTQALRKQFDADTFFQKADATIALSFRKWVEDINRVSIKGSGIQWPGGLFCQLIARNEGVEIEWNPTSEIVDAATGVEASEAFTTGEDQP